MSSPTRIKVYFINKIASKLSKRYDQIMYLIDRFLSILFIIDLFPKSKNKITTNIILCRFKYYGNSNLESIEKITIEDSLVKYLNNKSKIEILYWDYGQPYLLFSIYFYFKVMYRRPSYLILSSYNSKSYFHPSLSVFKKLKRKNIKIISLWWDTCSPKFIDSIQSTLDIFHKHVLIENPLMNFEKTNEFILHKDKFIALYTPLEYHFEEHPKVFDVAFFGQVSYYRSIRKEYLDYLLENNINLYYGAFEKENQCSNEKYYEILSKAKIGINFSMSVDRHQLKSRVFETMLSGCMLLEEKNDQTSYYFNEGVDYDSFSTKEELLLKINFYLNNDNIRIKIANSGRQKVNNLYNGQIFWQKTLINI